jgi:hypothetical protein
VCGQIADAGGFAALVALLQQTPEQGSGSAGAGHKDRRAAEVQRQGTWVLFSLLSALPDRFQSAVNAGVVPVLQQLLGSPSVDTQSLAVKTLLALAASSEPAVQAAVLQQELFAPAAALLKSPSTVVQVGSIELLQLLLREHQQAPDVAADPVASTAKASAARGGGSSGVQTAVVALIRLLGSHDVEVQQAAYQALWAFISKAGPSALAQQVAKLLCSPHPTTQLAGCDLLIGLLTHLSEVVSVEELKSAGVIKASLQLLGSLEPAVQVAAAQAAELLAFKPEGVQVLVSIPDAVQQLVAALGTERTQQSAASALRWIAENSIMPWQLAAVRGRCGAELRAAGAIPAALDLLRCRTDPGSRWRPSRETSKSLMYMLQWCNMRPDAAAEIREAGGLEAMQGVLTGHHEVHEVRLWSTTMLHQGFRSGGSDEFISLHRQTHTCAEQVCAAACIAFASALGSLCT